MLMYYLWGLKITCLVSNWKIWRTPATRILKKTAVLLLPNCIMSLNSAECRYSLGTGRKKWTCVKAELQDQLQLVVEQIYYFSHVIRHPTPRLLIPKMILPGKSPIGSSIFRTLKKTELPYGRVLKILRNWFLASSFDKCSWMQQRST